MWRRGYNMRLPERTPIPPAGPGTTPAKICAWWLPRQCVRAYSFRTWIARGACQSVGGRRSPIDIAARATYTKYGYGVIVSQQPAIGMSWSFVIWQGGQTDSGG